MKRYILLFAVTVLGSLMASAQYYEQEGTCGTNVVWGFDGYTLTLSNSSKKGEQGIMAEYDLSRNIAPWNLKKLKIKKVVIGMAINRIGACAFANCRDLLDVEFQSADVTAIGWGAFLNCQRLRNISLPPNLKRIETIAFANCLSLPSVKIPAQCRVDDQAYLSCSNIQSLEIASTATIGHYAFATEVKKDGRISHNFYNAEIRKLPSNINANNAEEFGLSADAVSKYLSGQGFSSLAENHNELTSEVDSMIPQIGSSRTNTYALVIGNENYRFVPNVPFAIHDANVFADYCEKTLGIPSEQIHICENATKEMIAEEEFEWLEEIQNRQNKSLIVYYAGHGVPDIKNKNKAYILPTDVRGTKPQHGISLDDFYSKLGDLAFEQTSVFLDACFSGINRDNETVNEGLRGVEIAAEEGELAGGNVVVFSAAKGNETAQGFQEQGHGLFTYYLLKSLQDSYGSISYGRLADEIQKNVSRTAATLKLRKPQTPTTSASGAIAEKWRSLTF